VIPYFLIFSRFSLLNTYSGLIVVYVSLSLPFAIWLMVSYFEEIPCEMEEAALIDRATRLKALWHVILPQARSRRGPAGSKVRAARVDGQSYRLSFGEAAVRHQPRLQEPRADPEVDDHVSPSNSASSRLPGCRPRQSRSAGRIPTMTGPRNPSIRCGNDTPTPAS